jgi:hypothetical protein
MKAVYRRLGVAALAVVTVIVWLPFAGLVASIYLGSALHCAVDEASVHPCMFLGTDIGPTLYSGFVGGWLVLVTAPLMLVTAIAWIALLCGALVRHVRTRRRKA